LLLLFFAVLLGWAWVISGERGQQFFAAVCAKGIGWPVLFSISLAAFSLPCFAALTATLAQYGYVRFTPVIPADETSLAVVQDFYLWHLLASIPGPDIPKTVRWDTPFAYQDKLSGWILLVFKLVVILPVISSFAAWRDVRKELRKEKRVHSD